MLKQAYDGILNEESCREKVIGRLGTVSLKSNTKKAVKCEAVFI